MNTNQLNKLGKSILGSSFLGTYALDRIPNNSTVAPHQGYIINTDTHNLGGEHWIAVYFDASTIHVFDPFGLYYPLQLRQHLAQSTKPVIYNHVMFQPLFSQLCGEYCLQWLIAQLNRHYIYSRFSR
jgi:hypothetical protein